MKFNKEIDGYHILGRQVRHSDAIMLCDGNTDCQRIYAHHTLVSANPMEIEGVWFHRNFPSIAEAIAFVEKRSKLSMGRIQE